MERLHTEERSRDAGGALDARQALDISIFDRSSIPLGMVREDGVVLYTNQAAVRMFVPHSTVEEMIGRNITELTPTEFFRERVAIMRELAAKGTNGIIRDIVAGRQILTHLTILPKSRDSVLRTFVVINEMAEGVRESADNLFAEWREGENQDLGVMGTLTRREFEVLALLSGGRTAAEMARMLHRSEETIKTHKASLLRKLGCKNSVQLAHYAWRAGIRMSDAERFRH